MAYPNMGGYNAGYGNQQPGGYGGGLPAGPPSGVSPEVQQWFNAVDRDRSGKITAKELQAALVNGQGKNFSDQACNLMIGMFDMDQSGMFDKDKTGTIDINEFQQLYNYINQWLATFRTYDRDQSGHVEEQELAQAFQQMGFRFSEEFIKFLVSKSDVENHAKITVDQFIVLCVQIQKFTGTDLDCSTTDKYLSNSERKRRRTSSGNYSFNHLNGLDTSNLETQGRRGTVNEKLLREVLTIREEMNQLVNENVHLLEGNKQLLDDNSSLREKVKYLQEENERLKKEHRDALELTSWISSAREIVHTLNSSPLIMNRTGKSLPMSPLFETHNSSQRMPASFSSSRPDQLQNINSDEREASSFSGVFTPPQIKSERLDEEQQLIEEGSPYHTPLLNFDQVEFHPSTSRGLTLPITDMTAAEPMFQERDRIGREQLLFPEPVDRVCELCPGSRIYVSLSAMDYILNKKSHSSVARSCLEAVFKIQYLLSCSVQGNVAKGPYGKPDVQRPPLYKSAVECILKYAKYQAQQNNWKIEENTTIKKQMNTRLSELRNIAKYKAAAAAAEAGVGNGEHKG